MTTTPSTPLNIQARLLSLGKEMADLPAQIERAELEESAARRALKDAELLAKDRENELGMLAEGKNERERKASALKAVQSDPALHTLQGEVNLKADTLERAAAAHSKAKTSLKVKLSQMDALIEHSAWSREFMLQARESAALQTQLEKNNASK